MRLILRQALVVALLGAAAAAVATVVRPPAPPPAAVCGADEPAEASGAPRWVSPAEASLWVGAGDVVFVDARESADYLSGHITGALHQPPGATLSSLPSGRVYVCYCDSSEGCTNSLALAARLADLGADARVLEGGFPAWLAGGFPAEAGGGPAWSTSPVEVGL